MDNSSGYPKQVWPSAQVYFSNHASFYNLLEFKLFRLSDKSFKVSSSKLPSSMNSGSSVASSTGSSSGSKHTNSQFLKPHFNGG